MQKAQDAVTTESEARAQAVQNLDAKLTKQINDAKVALNANISRVEQAVTDEAGARAEAVESLKAQYKRTLAKPLRARKLNLTRALIRLTVP